MKNAVITYVVSSESSEALHRAKVQASENLRADHVLTHVGTAKDYTVTERHRVGDYFTSAYVVDANPNSFRLVFQPRQDADQYWKSIIVGILQTIKTNGVAIRSGRS